MSHLDTYRTQSGPQTRRERVQPTATGPLQSPLCVRGRRNPARDPRFPITADPALPHTLPSIQQQAGLRAPSPAQPPRGRPRQGPRRLRQPRRPGRRCVAQTISDRRVPFFQLASHPQPNTRCLSPTRGATRVAHVIARYRPRSRRDAPVDGPPMGLPSGSRAHGRMHASRRASRASFRASLSSETLNSERSLAFPCLFGCENEHDFSPSSRRTSSKHPSIHTSIRC